MPILWSRRQIVLVSLLGCFGIILLLEIIFVLPRTLEAWHPFDYWQYTEMGLALRQGRDPFGSGHYYPLTAILWIFVPLSLLPDWFRFVWVLGPCVASLILFRRQGVWLFLFVPLWFVVSDGMLDGWLLVPLAWLLANRPIWAGLGGAIVLFKPQLAILTVGYSVFRWMIERDWKNLGVFLGAMLVFYLPAFLIYPNWVGEMIAVLPDRAAQTTTVLPVIGGSLWSWGWLGIVGQFTLVLLLVATLVFSVRGFRKPMNRAGVVHLLGLLLTPVLFGSNQIMAAPTVRHRNEILCLVLVSLGALFVDRVLGVFGGGYAIIPLAALYFQSRNKKS